MRIVTRPLHVLVLAVACLVPARAMAQDADTTGAESRDAARFPLASPVASWTADESAVADPAPAAPPSAMQVGAPCDGGACCAPRGGMFALVETTFFWPQFTRNFLTSGFSNSLGTTTFESNSQLGSVDGAFIAAPRITLGIQGQCWGLLTRYWNATSWGSAFAPIPNLGGGDPSTGINAFDGFKAYTLDLEVQRRFCVGCWNMYGFLGTRYASVNNTRGLNIVNAFDGTVLSATSFASQSFNGTGLTWGLWGISPLWDCSPISLYFVNRYSFLWGNGKASSQTSASVLGLASADQANFAAAGTNNGGLFIAEVQLGIQWTAQLKCLPACAFFRTGVEWQYWNNGQSLNTSANSTAFFLTQRATATASAGDLLFNLIGLNICAGIMY